MSALEISVVQRITPRRTVPASSNATSQSLNGTEPVGAPRVEPELMTRFLAPVKVRCTYPPLEAVALRNGITTALLAEMALPSAPVKLMVRALAATEQLTPRLTGMPRMVASVPHVT